MDCWECPCPDEGNPGSGGPLASQGGHKHYPVLSCVQGEQVVAHLIDSNAPEHIGLRKGLHSRSVPLPSTDSYETPKSLHSKVRKSVMCGTPQKSDPKSLVTLSKNKKAIKMYKNGRFGTFHGL